MHYPHSTLMGGTYAHDNDINQYESSASHTSVEQPCHESCKICVQPGGFLNDTQGKQCGFEEDIMCFNNSYVDVLHICHSQGPLYNDRMAIGTLSP